MWKDLNIALKSLLMSIFLRNGIDNINQMKTMYNQFQNGGPKVKNIDKFYSTMEKVAEENNAEWNKDRIRNGERPLTVDEDFVRILNANEYDYKGYYDKYPNGAGNAINHWTDEFKTVYHPTFSDESKYSGKKSLYNPDGLPGGFWSGETFIPRMWQVDESNRFDIGGPTEKQRRALATQYFWENKMDKAQQYAVPSIYEGGDLPELLVFPERSQGEITPVTGNAITRAINNYTGELKYDLANNRVPSGKYTLPAAVLGAAGITGAASLPAIGEAYYAAGLSPLVMEGLAAPYTAHGLDNLIHGNADWQTALEIAPLGHYVMPIAKRIYPRLAPKIVDKYAAIKEAYNRNPEISKVGSIDDYNDYLKTVFPESKIQDIQYHMGPKGIEELKGSTGEIWNTNPKAKGIYVSPTKEYPELIRKHTTDRIEKPSALKYLWRNLTGNWDKANAKYTEMYPVLINTKNPLYTSGNWTWGMNQNKYDEVFSNYDGIVNSGTKWYQRAYEMPETIVPSSDQTLILGSNRDLQEFKQFMSKRTSASTITPEDVVNGIPENTLVTTPQITAENAVNITPEQPHSSAFSLKGPLKYNKRHSLGGTLYPDGGILGDVTRGMKVDTDQCATWSNRLLRNNGYLISGNAWNLNDVDTLFNGFAGLLKPLTYNRKDVEAYNHMASDNVYKNFDSSTLDKTKPYVVNMFYNNSPALKDAYNDGRNVTGTHTGLLTYDENKKKWIVTHNIHGKIHQENFIPLLSGKGKYGVTAIYQPREDNVFNRVRGFLGFADGGFIDSNSEFDRIMRPLNEYILR